MPHHPPCPFSLPAPSITEAFAILDALGPVPSSALAAMVDYGLNDTEIGRYYGLPSEAVAALRAHWRIGYLPLGA